MKETEIWLRREQVCERLACKPAHLYAMIARGEFPPAMRLAPKMAVWRDRDVAEFQRRAIEAHRGLKS